MRKWISQAKLQISEKIEKEEDQKYRKEMAEKEDGAENLTGELTDQHKEEV